MSKYQLVDNIDGEILGVRQIQNHGRVQIPKTVRMILQLRDGENVYWIKDKEGRIVLKKAGNP